MFASSASAYDPADLQKLKDTNECVDCDLIGADLQGANLSVWSGMVESWVIQL